MNQLLCINDAARRLQISRATLYRMAATGQIKIAKLGRKSFVSSQSVEDIIARVIESAES